LNKNRDRYVCEVISEWHSSTLNFRYCVINIKAIILIVTGFIGGILSAISGSGIDICSFAILTLLFRVSEKTATPTSVVIMAINTCFGFFWRCVVQNQIDIESWKYFAVCIPVVVAGAPIGSLISSYLNRLCLAKLIYILDGIQLIAAIIIIQPWNISIFLTISSILIFFLFVLLFYKLSKLGLDTVNRQTNNLYEIGTA
jgi:hypothetical protein